MGKSESKKLSLYPLKFEETISDVLKVKPEPKRGKDSRKRKRGISGAHSGTRTRTPRKAAASSPSVIS